MKPRRVKILGRVIPIKYRKDTDDSFAEYILAPRSIEINEGLSEEDTFRILAHECMHAALDISGVKNLLDDKTEEAICDLSEALVGDLVELALKHFKAE